MSNEQVAAGGPVTGEQRLAYLDILRGFAVMAIFAVNIKAMTMPFAYYGNPSLWGTELEQLIAVIQKFIVDDKWRTTFTALYGAGLLMIWQRLEARGETRGLLARRNGFLLLFGAIHMVFIWVGDILTLYALIGFAALLFVRMGPIRLWIFGLVFLVIGIAWAAGFQMLFNIEELSAKMAPKFWSPTEESLAVELAAMGGGITEQLMFRATSAAFVLPVMLLSGMGMITLALMLLGMALFKGGLYRGAWPFTLALPLAVVALGAAWGLDAWQIAQLKESDYAFETYNNLMAFAMLDGVLGAFGYGCLISALVSLGIKFSAFAAVGRMAFTNYITCSLIGTTVGGGHALGMFGETPLTLLVAIVLGTYVAMLIWSPLWLKFFRFGPLEWVWRSMVYKTPQPFRR
ncbi:DUF418 domain-containing protein [Parvularcula sp. ZS-1/3]|uniref:DUF418 domain-containing protein n=1 Tax=Parvularcula mediterranea TaxID=2732508 RepID=A0A7Y3W610_9PROT|nr:DUF418 domain-containing protein [Parvularcula mediterranea]NNU16882.1 DUF418 domain-containing protein [Parvularcula mediterranea]